MLQVPCLNLGLGLLREGLAQVKINLVVLRMPSFSTLPYLPYLPML